MGEDRTLVDGARREREGHLGEVITRVRRHPVTRYGTAMVLGSMFGTMLVCLCATIGWWTLVIIAAAVVLGLIAHYVPTVAVAMYIAGIVVTLELIRELVWPW